MIACRLLKRLSALEKIAENAPALLLFPNDDGSYTAQDAFHKGQRVTESMAQCYAGPVILCDLILNKARFEK